MPWLHLGASSANFLRAAAIVLMLVIGGCKQLAMTPPASASLATDWKIPTWNPRTF